MTALDKNLPTITIASIKNVFELHLYQTLLLGISRTFYAFEMLHKFKYMFFKTPSELTNYPSFTYMETDKMTRAQPYRESVANSRFMLRDGVQVQCSNDEMTPIPDIDSDMSLGHTAQRLQPIAESKKKPRVGFPFLFSTAPGASLQSGTCY